ncbi:hypothetical protein HMPREF9498_01435 [Enterococcus faecalis TX4248]|uniref:Uncharacterized protein n=3 Tax=Enterococcus faecalis TaxID=1351 RepID=A0A1W6QWV3_ENTFL|nr:hypothetical protein [Enterococcus faecalis]EFM82965.1 hypothetical protein HMPREF9498_01435 [Enterococcus faecalis TX4248]EPI11787.1 hypothetical protein D358_00200 [Enterococcus faecalis RP2S-4]EGO8595687.1 hypothetical protein [Enterococcus faecalis]EGO8681956.1 hypothetical protein [Enterococcus faecalis]
MATKDQGSELQCEVNSATYIKENRQDRKRAIIWLLLEFGVTVARNPANYLVRLVNKRRLGIDRNLR